jgi:selenide, water dikinase
MGPCDLHAVLESLPHDEGDLARLLETRDDAAVVALASAAARLPGEPDLAGALAAATAAYDCGVASGADPDDLCLVQTVDFFTPIVDSPIWFGRIAAANALSDVYAMGARPLTAMNLVAWPSSLGTGPLVEVLRGGSEKIAESGAALAGGHSIDDKEPKYGLAVTGLARRREIVYNHTARVGDLLVLTKPIGLGVLASALKNGLIDEDDMMPAIEAAAALNAAAASAMQAAGAHACTDVSGFGLAGHLIEMLEASGLAAQVELDDVPIHDGVLPFIERQVYAGGLRNNREWFGPRVEGGEAREARVAALFDPQTSGGLLIAIGAEHHDDLLAELASRDVHGWTLGEVVHGPAGRVALR